MIRNHKQFGFTLIELMVVIAVIGILAAIAFPSYQQHIRKSRRNDGMNALLEAAEKLEIVRARTGAYSTVLADGNINAESEKGYYGNLTIAEPTAACPISNCYVIEITGQAGQENDDVTAYRLSSTGVKERNAGGWTTGWK